MDLLKEATKYSLMAIGSLAVINEAVVLWKPTLKLKPKLKIVAGAGSSSSGGIPAAPSTLDNVSDSIILQDELKKESASAMLLHVRKPPKMWNTAFFFPDPDHDNEEVPDSSTKKLMELLNSAKLSIKLCMYLGSYGAIENVILKKFLKDGLIVQLVTCHETTTAHNNFQVSKYAKKGIPVRTKSSAGNFMHHKFVIIDDEAVITGSLNWTRNGIERNRENVIVTTDPRIVEPYRKEFATLWNNFDEYAL